MQVPSPSNWITVTESNFAWEREALEYIRQHFPNCEPYRAWSNFEFIASDGSINEIDLLAFTAQGVFLVEIKSRPGRLSGDAGTWSWENDGKSRVYDNPLILANSKAKKLKSLLDSSDFLYPEVHSAIMKEYKQKLEDAKLPFQNDLG